MVSEHAVAHDEMTSQQDAWSGGKPPFKASYGKLMMWYFLLSDAFTFAGFLIAYGALRVSMPTWPVPDFVFSTFPGGLHDMPLIFVTVMTFVLLFSSYTMVRAVQEGKRENKKGVTVWMLWTIVGGLAFLSCQAWEWTNLIAVENMSVTRNTFGSYEYDGVYLDSEGNPAGESFKAGESYLIHRMDLHGDHGDAHGSDSHGDDAHAEGHDDHGAHSYDGPGDYADAYVDEQGFIHRKFQWSSGPLAGQTAREEFGPKAFGALFFLHYRISWIPRVLRCRIPDHHIAECNQRTVRGS